MTMEKMIEVSDKDFVVTILLCFFLGGLGVHRFYVGKIGTGILMLITCGGLGIWSLVDFIMIVCGVFRDVNGLPIKQQVIKTNIFFYKMFTVTSRVPNWQ